MKEDHKKELQTLEVCNIVLPLQTMDESTVLCPVILCCVLCCNCDVLSIVMICTG